MGKRSANLKNESTLMNKILSKLSNRKKSGIRNGKRLTRSLLEMELTFELSLKMKRSSLRKRSQTNAEFSFASGFF